MPINTGQLDGKELAELMKLIDGADSVELKLTIPDADSRRTMAALELDPIEAQIRQVVFFDTPDLQLNGIGLVVRARRSQGATDDSVIKLRPVVPEELPRTYARQRLQRRGRRHARRLRVLGSYKAKSRWASQAGARSGAQIRKLFSKPQRASTTPTPPMVSGSTTSPSGRSR